ncbi:MAG: CNNM domain-containing protein [Oligoflexia bacterium]|nr:CNNM domain-containing protein [Oligoflexia bacterium]
MSSFELLTCLALISMSAFLSASEVALFSLSRFQLRELKEHLRPALHKKIKQLLGDPGGLLITILVMNEIVNISLSTLITNVVSRSTAAESPLLAALPGWRHIPSWAVDMILSTLLTTPVVLLFCEVTPKVIGARVNQLMSTLSGSPLYLFYETMKPVRFVLNQLVLLVARLSDPQAARTVSGQPNGDAKDGILKESDFLFMLEEGHREGAIHDSELGLIRNVFEFDDTTASDVLKPLSQVMTLSPHITLKAALAAFRGQRYSRIPVVGPGRKVVGILYSKDLLRSKLDPEHLSLQVSAVMRKPFFVSSTARLNALFRKFKQERTHMAIVQGPAGETLGVVTMNDVLEALFEDLLKEAEG